MRIVLSGRGIACPDCGMGDPVEPHLAKIINRLRYKLEACDTSQQQLTGRRARIGFGGGFRLLALLFGIWAVIAIAVVWAFYPTHYGLTPMAFLFRAPGPFEYVQRLSISWWVIWGTSTGFAATMALYARGLVRQRRLPELALPRAASRKGGAPHCRCCAAELPDNGMVRRCFFCQADHLFVDGAYQPIASDAMDGLGQIEDQLDNSLGRALKTEQRHLLATVTIPLLVAAVAPVGMILAPLVPDLWLVTALLALFALIQITAAAALGVAVVPVVITAALGDTISADGVDYEVVARLEGTWPTVTSKRHVQAPAWILTQLGFPDERSVLQPTPEKGRDVAFFLYECSLGGESIGSDARGAATSASITVESSGDASWREGRTLWSNIRWIDKQKLADIRLFDSEAPVADERPIWTLCARRKLPTGHVQITHKNS